MFDDRLLAIIIASTVVLLALAIEYNVSPGFTIYVFKLIAAGIIIFCPILNTSLDRLLISFILDTVVLYFLAILYNVSPDTFFM